MAMKAPEPVMAAMAQRRPETTGGDNDIGFEALQGTIFYDTYVP
jgi:hypothetical protein